ncbi:condensation protein [Affinibrenneria salicis]|uniref:Condensation protein n=1 Tax=Affinibrenneria salicis TaxID=2590031 RepID=A0A5J5G359_9GAMM|nr:condensation domain-containing protein [Affinibrenneria salicis]KAA9001298.1 condensation protein [Affinibrenneria salicis]
MTENFGSLLTEEETRRFNAALADSDDDAQAAGPGQPLSAGEEQAWLRHQQESYPPEQCALAWRLGAQINPGRLVSALEAVLKTVPGLNVRYRFDTQGELRKFAVDPLIQPVDMQIVQNEGQAIASLRQRQNTPFALHLEPPVRFLLFIGAPHGVVLGVITHAILDNQLSWRQILSALTAIYNDSPLPAFGPCAAGDGIVEMTGLADGGRRVALPGLYRCDAPEVVDFVNAQQNSAAVGATARRYGTVLNAGRLALLIPADRDDAQADLTAFASLFGVYLSMLGGGDAVTIGLPGVGDERAPAEAGQSSPPRRMTVRHCGEAPGDIVARQAHPAPGREISAEQQAEAGCHAAVIRLLDPSAALLLEGVAATRIPLPPAHCIVDLTLAVGVSTPDGLALELIVGPQVSPHIGGFLLEQFVAWLDGRTAAAQVVANAPKTAPAPGRTDDAAQREAPAEDGETIVRRILDELREALSYPQLTADDDFFDYGGHSLIATRVIGRLLSLHNIEIHLNDLFSHPTARGLAGRAQRHAGAIAVDRVVRSDEDAAASVPLSLAQKSLWQAWAAVGFSEIFNIPFALRFLDPVDEAAFRQALLDVLARHGALRTRFVAAGSEVRQQVVAFSELPRYSWFWFSNQSEEADWREVLAQEAGYRFDLATELPLRIKFIRDGASGQQILSLLFHHIVLDEWSVNLLMDELAHAYPCRAANRAPEWRGQPAPFHAFADGQHKTGVNQSHLDYWVGRLRGAPGAAPLFATEASAAPVSSSCAGGWTELKLESQVAGGLYRLAREHGASLFNVAYAGIAAALRRLGAPDDMVIGTSASGRHDARFFDTIGYFTTVVAHRLRFGESLTLAELIEQVKNNINQSMPYSDIPIDLVESALADDGATARGHMFEIFIQLHAKNKLNGRFTLDDGRAVAFRQVDPDKSESLLGLQFEVMEEVIDGETAIRVLMSYRADHYDAERVALIVSTLSATFDRLAEPLAGRQSLTSLLSPPARGGERAS